MHSGVVMDELEVSTCNSNYLAPPGAPSCTGLTMTPDSLLLAISGTNNIYLIDQTSGNWSLYYSIPPPFTGAFFLGIVSVGNGVFYSVTRTPNRRLFEINVNTGTVTDFGNFPFSYGEFALFNGEIYFTWIQSSPVKLLGIRKLNLLDPANSELVVDLQYTDYHIEGISGSILCNTLIAPKRHLKEFIYINLIDGVITPVCESVYENLVYITSMMEFEAPVCEVYLDLDEDDSSGAIEADYNGENFNCLSHGERIADIDLEILYDALISEMTIEIVGFIPDAPNENLEMIGSIPNIDVTGEGTPFITLTNDGDAKSTDFKDALRAIRYNNTALDPTEGMRTVEVQFTTESGAMSNVAVAFIEVTELPLVEVDLGPNQTVCEGETATFDAGNPGADYIWSNGTISQTITVVDEGQYIVTVSDGINCPNQDTVELTLLPVVHVALEGEFQTCDNIPLTLTISTDSPFPLTIEVSATPGSPFVFNNVIGSFTFNDLPTQETEYTITSVTPSQPACIEITDPVQLIDVYPSYIHSFDSSICEGDSIWLGFYWETDAGIYENTFSTFEGCDSIVTTNLSVLPAITIYMQGTTCDSAAAGVFIEYLNNPNGCDTIRQTTISFIPRDTTYAFASSCVLTNTGVFQQLLTNQEGCDSLVVTTINWIPPADTTFLFQATCDSSQTGVFQQLLPDQYGCDSIVVTTINIGVADTTFVFGVSCDMTMIGVSETLYNNQQGCDSLVITTISAGIPDTTYLQTTSCDSASLGVFEEQFISTNGCDSIVVTTITYSANDSTFIQSVSCDPDDVGIFTDVFINTFGCDSIVTTTISLLQDSETHITSTTCDPDQAGVFVANFSNQFGCDSIVTTTVQLLPSDATFLSSTTCMSSESGVFVSNYLNQYGCDSIVTSTVVLVHADTTLFLFKTCDPSEVGTIQSTFISQDGCDSLVIKQTTLYPLPELEIEITSDYNGYPISCAGQNDGSVSANAIGALPIDYLWSTNSTELNISDLSTGSYTVTITDANGCTSSGAIFLDEPKKFSISFIISQPNCFDHQDGSITVEPNGGITPIRYSIDEVNYQSSPVFSQLTGGTYTITAIDANDCETKEIIWINVPLMVHVELGDDQIILSGDTTIINAIVNVPYDSLANITWNGLDHPDCPTCLAQAVAPIITTTYSVTVTTLDGCMDEDAMTLFLDQNNEVFVPNIFSPNGDGINDVIIISAGSSVEEILEFVVLDRWGNIVHFDDRFQANTIAHAWDGTMKQKKLNPGVFAYKVTVQFTDGTQDVMYGDITLTR